MTKVSVKRPEDSAMSPKIEAANLLRGIAEPRRAGDYIKTMVDRATKAVRDQWPDTFGPPPSPSRIEDIWRQEARIIRAEEMDTIRAAAAAAEDARITGEVRSERRRIEDRLARIEAALRISDEDFHSETLGALRQLGSRQNRTVD